MIGFEVVVYDDEDDDEVTELEGVVWVEETVDIDDANDWVLIGGIGSVLGIGWVKTFSWLTTTDSETACKLSRSIFTLLLMGSKLN